MFVGQCVYGTVCPHELTNTAAFFVFIFVGLIFPSMIVQVLFGYLQESETKFLDTTGMCRACKDSAGKPVDPLEQQVGPNTRYFAHGPPPPPAPR